MYGLNEILEISCVLEINAVLLVEIALAHNFKSTHIYMYILPEASTVY